MNGFTWMVLELFSAVAEWWQKRCTRDESG